MGPNVELEGPRAPTLIQEKRYGVGVALWADERFLRRIGHALTGLGLVDDAIDDDQCHMYAVFSILTSEGLREASLRGLAGGERGGERLPRSDAVAPVMISAPSPRAAIAGTSRFARTKRPRVFVSKANSRFSMPTFSRSPNPTPPRVR